MDSSYIEKIQSLGFTELVCDVFPQWEDVKDEILVPDRKQGSGNGTIHIFLGAAYDELQAEFPAYFDAVANGEDPAVGAVRVKHYFLPTNIVSMLGHVCKYYHDKDEEYVVTVNGILEAMGTLQDEGGFLVTESLFKISTGASKLRPYFKQFEANGVFSKIVRPILLANSAYKISLFKNEEGEYAALWLIGFDSISDFEADSNASAIMPVVVNSSSDNDVTNNIMLALRTKPFLLLAGISGTGKSRIVRELAFRSCPAALQDADHTTPGNYLMVEVKPNWHDSSELLGYNSNITKSYHFTKFIDFLVLAHANPDVPFFVCLDEMNLAPVEQYFAEFLSVLETRRYPKGDMTHIKTGRLVDKKYMVSHSGWGKDEDLTLPDNLFVIGTVNMDDTTHQFSRKVIDRAMTIEMNGGDLSDMFGRSQDLEYLPASDVWKLKSFAPEYVTADEALDKHPAEAEQMKKELTERLQAINIELENTPFQVSYRVLNELCIYTAVLLDDGFAIDEAIEEAVDQIALMKILPRIEGDEDLFSIRNENVNKLDKLKDLFDPGSDSWKKLDEMNKRLGNGGGFTRFWP